MTSVAIRLNENELDYLKKIAQENKICKKGNDISIGKTIKELIRWCELNKISFSQNTNNLMTDNLVKMIEQIHVSIPHLLYLLRFQTLSSFEDSSDEKIKKYRYQSVDYANKTCGDFQNINYNAIRFSMNDIGFKTIPSDKEKTQWILP
jgi:hypothetical protein